MTKTTAIVVIATVIVAMGNQAPTTVIRVVLDAVWVPMVMAVPRL